MKVLILSVAVFITGCSTLDSGKSLVTEKTVIKVDKRTLSACKPLPKLAGPTDKDHQVLVEQISLAYVECANTKADLVKIIRPAFNLKED